MLGWSMLKRAPGTKTETERTTCGRNAKVVVRRAPGQNSACVLNFMHGVTVLLIGTR